MSHTDDGPVLTLCKWAKFSQSVELALFWEVRKENNSVLTYLIANY